MSENVLSVPRIRLKNVVINDFKRFTDLTVENIPENARLIMLAGPNGSGKSSFFDALNTWQRYSAQQSQNWDVGYHRKISSSRQDTWQSDVKVTFHNPEPSNTVEKKKAFYFRSAYRNDPDFQTTRLNRVPDLLDHTRFNRMIDNDAAVSQNYQRMASQGLEDVYEREEPGVTIGEFREKTIGEVQRAMLRIFPNLELNSLGNPLSVGTFKFTKGASSGFLFKNLSGGEKAVFDLILDLVIARREFDRTIYCIDEPESHMNSRLQAELLSVLYDLTPPGCQLVLATHSIGMMRRARDVEVENPGSVAFLDFDNQDFDRTVVIEPKNPDRDFWQNAYKVALDDIAALIAPTRVVICEGTPLGTSQGKNVAHDAKCYDVIFRDQYPDTKFISGGNASDVETDRLGIAEAIRTLVDGLVVIRVVDRDDQSDQEINDQHARGIQVLRRRNIESYLFDNEVLEALASTVGKTDLVAEILEKKHELLGNSSSPADDLKPVSGQLYVECKNALELQGCGNTAIAFARDTLAPLIQPGMNVYEELRQDIFGA